MKTNWDVILNFTIAMLAIVNPVEKIPLWVAASASKRKGFQWLLCALVVFTCAVILLFFLWYGKQLLEKLQVDLASFKIGGGLILLQFGFSMMKGTALKIAKAKETEQSGLREEVLHRYQQIFIPIGVPVIAGPGAITTVIIYGHQSTSVYNLVLLSIIVVSVLAILFVTLLTGFFIQRTIGSLPLELISRVFGMIIIAIAVQFMVEGLSVVFPGWVR